MSKVMKAAIACYRRLKEHQPGGYDFREPELNGLGYYYLAHGDVTTAVTVSLEGEQLMARATATAWPSTRRKANDSSEGRVTRESRWHTSERLRRGRLVRQ